MLISYIISHICLVSYINTNCFVIHLIDNLFYNYSTRKENSVYWKLWYLNTNRKSLSCNLQIHNIESNNFCSLYFNCRVVSILTEYYRTAIGAVCYVPVSTIILYTNVSYVIESDLNLFPRPIIGYTQNT